MRSRPRRFLSFVLLATYASIAILGEGLHELMPHAGHHHHDGLFIVHRASHGPEHADRDAGYQGISAGPVLIASDSDLDSHVCEICAFLFQAVSQPVEVAAPIDWRPLAVAAS